MSGNAWVRAKLDSPHNGDTSAILSELKMLWELDLDQVCTVVGWDAVAPPPPLSSA